MKKVKVLIVDDHKIIRAGLRTLLELENDEYNFQVTEAENCETAVAKVKKSRYDIALVDYQMPKVNGVETTKAILKQRPNIPVLALSNYNDFGYISSFLEAGAKGYILKDIGSWELVKAIASLLKGKNYFSNEVALTLLRAKNNFKSGGRSLPEKKFSDKERSILKLISRGLTSKQIALKLFISKHSVDKYRKQLLAKMKVRNAVGLLTKARKMKLID